MPTQYPLGLAYWADMGREMQGLCSSVAYNRHQTAANAWTDFRLQDEYYNEALKVRAVAALHWLVVYTYTALVCIHTQY